MLQLVQERQFSLQNIKTMKKRFNHSSRSLHKNFKLLINADEQINRGNTMISIINKESSLKTILNKFNNSTQQLIDRISPKMNVKKLFKIDHNKQFVRNNNKISQLYEQIKKDEQQINKYSNGQHIKHLYSLQQRKKSDLKRNIIFLKRCITSNSRQLLQKSYNNNIRIFDLQYEREKLNRKLNKIQFKNDSVIQKNELTLKRIREIQSKIKEYESTGLFVVLNQQNALNSAYIKKVAQLQKLKLSTDRQRNRLQHLYYTKLKDLQYQMAGCQAISNKIAQIQQRITKLNNNNEYQSQRHATMPVKSDGIILTNKSFID